MKIRHYKALLAYSTEPDHKCNYNGANFGKRRHHNLLKQIYLLLLATKTYSPQNSPQTLKKHIFLGQNARQSGSRFSQGRPQPPSCPAALPPPEPAKQSQPIPGRICRRAGPGEGGATSESPRNRLVGGRGGTRARRPPEERSVRRPALVARRCEGSGASAGRETVK